MLPLLCQARSTPFYHCPGPRVSCRKACSLVQHGHDNIHVCACSGVREYMLIGLRSRIFVTPPSEPGTAHLRQRCMLRCHMFPPAEDYASQNRKPPAAARRRGQPVATVARSLGVFPARRRSRDCGIVSTAGGCAALKLALVGYAGSAQHEVTRLQRQPLSLWGQLSKF